MPPPKWYDGNEQKRSLPHGKENKTQPKARKTITSNNLADLLKSYEKLDAHKEERIIRNLCRIRTAMERNYAAIASEFRLSIRNISSVPDLIPSESVAELERDGIRIYKTKSDIDEYIISINMEISNRINQAMSFS